MKPTPGDIRCIVYGHLTRLGVWQLRKNWDASLPTPDRLERFAAAVAAFGDSQTVIDTLTRTSQALAAGVADTIPLFA